MKLTTTIIALVLTSTSAMASGVTTATSDPVVQSPRPPEVCRKVPIANTNATQWMPQGCNGSVAGGEAEDVAAPTPTPETPQAPDTPPAPETPDTPDAPPAPPAPAPETPPAPDAPDVPDEEDEEGEEDKDKSNASDHNDKGGNQFDGTLNSDKG